MKTPTIQENSLTKYNHQNRGFIYVHFLFIRDFAGFFLFERT